MRLGLLTPTKASNVLAHGIERSIATEHYRPGVPYDLVMIFNHVVNGAGYEYPEFPDPRIPIAFLDVAEYGSTVRPQGLRTPHETKNPAQQDRLLRFLEGRSFPYFLREFTPEFEGRPGYHPIDYPLNFRAVCNEPPNRDEYLRRSVDVACLWGMSNPCRWPITERAREWGGTRDVYAIEFDGPRIPQSDYYRRLRAARCSISADGYGSSSFRMTEILVRTVLLQAPLSIRLRAPAPCVPFDSDPTDAIRWVTDNPEAAFDVYAAGYEHTMTHLTEAATTRAIMETIERHDWSAPTWI